MSRRTHLLPVLVLAAMPWAPVVAAPGAPGTPAPPAGGARAVMLATCEEGRLELALDDGGRPRELRGEVRAPDGERWSFAARPAMARLGRRTRTLAGAQRRSRAGT